MRYMFYTIPLLVLALKYNINIVYIIFLLLSIPLIKNRSIKSIRKVLILGVYSIILPDNYSAELFFIIYAILALSGKTKFRLNRYSQSVILFVFVALIGVVLNFVNITNILFGVICFFPLILFLWLMGEKSELALVDFSVYIARVLWIELLTVPLNFLFYHTERGDDWSSGTFGVGGGQQAQLFVITALICFYYICLYIKKKEKRTLFKICGSFIILISTNCWTLVAVFVGSFIVIILKGIDRKLLKKCIILVLVMPVIIGGFIKFVPDNIKNVGLKIVSDRNYLDYRFHKVTTYKNTFYDIPISDFKFAILGNGVGNYNSRAALICTGKYVEFYDKLFEPSISEYTEKYIYDYVELAYLYGESDYGSVIVRPYSSIMALMGECGYLGLFLFIYIVLHISKGRNKQVQSLIIMWLFFCMVENYFEYPKVIVILYACIGSLICKANEGRLNELSIKSNLHFNEKEKIKNYD